MKNVCVEQLLEVGIALSKEKNNDKLFELILTAAMDITNCDGGTLYSKEDGKLVFQLMFTRSSGAKQGGRYEPIKLPAVPLSRNNVCSCAALDNTLINIKDVYESEHFDFSGPKNYDAITGYKTVSMLVIPMEDDGGNCIGVLQLINALDIAGSITAFDKSYERVILSLASQAAICKVNMTYAAEIQELLDSLVRVMSTTIDALTPYNANHTRNMVKYGERFMDWLEETGHPWQFDLQMRRQFLMGVWLHDSGKITVPLTVMNKETRLGEGLERVMNRLRVIELSDELALLQGRLGEVTYASRRERLQNGRGLILKINSAGFLQDELLMQLKDLMKETYIDENDELCHWLTAEELEALSVRKGTLTEEERCIMESHVIMTDKMLSQIKFPEKYDKVRQWASSHHEFLDGSGYPNKLSGDAVPIEVRLLTVLDIFDALTARDRPYKPGMPAQKALAIMDEMQSEGKLDKNVLELFKQSHAWEEIA